MVVSEMCLRNIDGRGNGAVKGDVITVHMKDGQKVKGRLEDIAINYIVLTTLDRNLMRIYNNYIEYFSISRG